MPAADGPLPTGEPGEVCIRGAEVMTGYQDRPEEAAATLVDGLLRTGLLYERIREVHLVDRSPSRRRQRYSGVAPEKFVAPIGCGRSGVAGR